MKYLFINVVAGVASTGRIVEGQCRELMRAGQECRIAHGRTAKNCDGIDVYFIGSDWDHKLHGLSARLLDNQGFCSAKATEKFLKWVKEYDPDVIWLHNLHGYYLNVELLFDYLKTSGKKIYWTLHDCWSFTGHCTYFDFVGCDKWKTGCSACPQKKAYPACYGLDGSRRNYEKKKEIFTGVPNMTLITPSKWLAGLVKESFLNAYPVEVVYNKINRDIFQPTPGDFRERHGLTEKFLVLGVASVWEPRKGMDHFVKLAGMLDDRYRIVLVGVTPEQAKGLPGNVIPIARTNSAKELAEIYSAADVFVNPTLEDNLPTVNLEAVACGCRVVTFDTGGCGETITEEDILVSAGDTEELCRQIQFVCENGEKQ